jgi:hypothetical protein
MWRGETYAVFWWGNLKERDHWGDPCIDGRLVGCGVVDWIEVAQDMDR